METHHVAALLAICAAVPTGEAVAAFECVPTTPGSNALICNRYHREAGR
jgi:hypothetical protein